MSPFPQDVILCPKVSYLHVAQACLCCSPPPLVAWILSFGLHLCLPITISFSNQGGSGFFLYIFWTKVENTWFINRFYYFFRCNTDIQFGNQRGMTTLLVETGVHKLQNLQQFHSSNQTHLIPSYYTASIADLLEIMALWVEYCYKSYHSFLIYVK